MILFASVNAQIGGNGAFMVSKLPVSGRHNGLAQANIAAPSREAAMAMINPALMNADMHNKPYSNLNTYLGKGWVGNVGYAYLLPKDWGIVALNAAYVDFGTIDYYDAFGNSMGSGTANESLFVLSYAKALNQGINIGANLKMVYSSIGPYIGGGVATDLGITKMSNDSVWTFAMNAQNLGIQVLNYKGGKREFFPFQINAGFTVKPRHAPFRLHFVYNHLQKWDLTYNQYIESNSIDINTGRPEVAKEAKFGTKLLRHISLAPELVVGKYFSIMVGYNHRLRSEMAPNARKGFTGFSWGVNFKINRFQLSYSLATYFPGFSMNCFTVSASISEFKRRK